MWPTAQLANVALVFNGKTPSKAEHREIGHPVLKIKDVTAEGRFCGYFTTHVEPSLASRYREKFLRPRDTLVLNAAHHASHVASKIYLAEAPVTDALPTGEWLVLRASSDNLDPDYLHYSVLRPEGLAQIKFLVKGIHLYPKDVATIKIPLPPLPEQRRIVDILNRANGIRRLRREALGKFRQLIPALFVDMFGDPATNPKGWPEVQLGDVLASIDGGWSPKCHDKAPSPGEWGVLKLSAVTSGHFRPHECKTLPSELMPRPNLEVRNGDLLFTRKNTHELVAATALVRSTPPRLLLSDLIFRLRVAHDGPLIPDYLWACLANPSKRRQVQSLASGSAGSMPNISKGRLRTARVCAPPTGLQGDFAESAADIQATIAQQERMAEGSDQLVASLMAQLFDGGNSVDREA